MNTRKKDQELDSPESNERVKKKIYLSRDPPELQEILVEIVFHARLLWNRDGYVSRTPQAEERDFREYFGCGPFVVSDLWTILVKNDVLPPNASVNKLLWSLFFLKRYSTEGQLCNAIKIDRKLFRETCWAFIEAIALIQSEVVSFNKLQFIY